MLRRRRRDQFILSTILRSSATSCGSMRLATARSQSSKGFWFLSMASPTGATFSLLFWQSFSFGSTVRPFTLRFIATHGTRLIGAASARLAMISSTGAVPEPVTARILKLSVEGDYVVCVLGAGSEHGVAKTWRAQFLRGTSTTPLVGGKAEIVRVDKRTTTIRVKMLMDAVAANPSVLLSPPPPPDQKTP